MDLLQQSSAYHLVTDHISRLRDFQRETYEQSFYEYIRVCSPYLKKCIEECSEKGTELQRYGASVAESLLEICKYTRGLRKGKIQKKRMEEIQMFLAFFTIPMLGIIDTEETNQIADGLLESWNERTLMMPIIKANLEEIQKGFSNHIYANLIKGIWGKGNE